MKGIGAALDRFSATAAAVRKQAPVDPRLVPVLVFLIAELAIEALYIAASELTFPVGLLMRVFWVLLLILAGGMLARRYGLTRTGNSLQAMALAPILSALAVVAMVILTRFSTSFSDAILVGADRALGVDWMAIFDAFKSNPLLFELGRIAYLSFYWQFIAICLVLFALGKPGHGARFINAWAIALTLSVLIYPFFTAMGPYYHFGIVPADIPQLHSTAPWTTGPIIEGIREGRRTDVIGSMTGLIFFPSFHAAGAVMFMRGWWTFRALRWLAIPLNLLLIAAAPVFGLHYFVDLLGGIAVALVAILAAERLTTRIETAGHPAANPGLHIPQSGS